MKTYAKMTTGALALGALAACSGESTKAPIPNADAYYDVITSASLAIPAAPMPASGVASYSGAMVMDVGAGPIGHIGGEVALGVDYDLGTMSGSVGNFVFFRDNGSEPVDEAFLTGSAAMTGSFAGTTGTLDVDGTIEDEALTGQLNVGFYLPDAAQLNGSGFLEVDGAIMPTELRTTRD